MSKKDVKFYVISILLHSLLFLPLLVNGKKTNLIQISLNASADSTVIIVPQSDGKTIKKSKNGYYGIGIYTNMAYVNCQKLDYRGYVVNSVIHGYGAEAAGIQRGDIIIGVNGKSISSNHIRGNKPKILTLTICRNNYIIKLTVNRNWVNTN